MQPRLVPRVKVCCITSIVEAWIAVDAGASALGLVSAMPSGPGVIVDDELAAAIARSVPPGVDTFLLTSLQDAAAIAAQYRVVRPTTLQLVDHVERAELIRLRADLPGVRLVQVIHVTDDAAEEEAAAVADLVDAVLLDSGDPDLATKELGGTGRRHDWAVSARIRERLVIPIFLAGGLNPANVAEAIGTVGSYGLDVCSGLRRDGRLDPGLTRDFFAAIAVPAGPGRPAAYRRRPGAGRRP